MIASTDYYYISKSEVTRTRSRWEIMEDMERYLRPTPNIECDNSVIVEKAQSLTNMQWETAERARNLFYFVRDGIKYNPYRFILAPEYFRASETLERGDGFCVQKAVLLIALARAVEIPARLLFADIRNYCASQDVIDLSGTNLFTHHGYCELYIDRKWIKATPVFDLKTCVEDRFISVEFDGRSDAILHSRTLDGKLHIEYVKFHGHYDDVPLEEMIQTFIQVYGSERLELCTTGLWVDAINRSR
jgi:transglutaminase-like putative cysteine protease